MPNFLAPLFSRGAGLAAKEDLRLKGTSRGMGLIAVWCVLSGEGHGDGHIPSSLSCFHTCRAQGGSASPLQKRLRVITLWGFRGMQSDLALKLYGDLRQNFTGVHGPPKIQGHFR